VPLQPGTLLGPFEVLHPLGQGGMGEVYRARDTRLGREVALKVLPRELLTNREGLVRFAQEARAASSLNHPNIVTLFEIGQFDSSPFLAMELIDGQTLRRVVEKGVLPIRRALDLATQLAEGLAKAHEAGIVHRDLKPDNVMVTRDGFVKILDFGIAKLQGPVAGAGDLGLTQAGFILGTPDYMSPEQAAGRAVDFRSDQFALGVILYEMLSGRRAFHRETTVQTLSAIIQDEPEPLERSNPKIPAPMRWVVERCLAKEPDDRYGSTRDLARDLRQIRDRSGDLLPSGESRAVPAPETKRSDPSPGLGETEVLPAAPSAPLRTRSRFRRAAELLLLLLLGIALFAGGTWTGIWFREQQIEPPPPTWKADLLVGPMTRVLAPRVSPDGSSLAFVTLAGQNSQVAVMKPSSGDWTVLTRRDDTGSVQKVCWSRDGNKLFFDRVSDIPRGVFSIPPLGGEERLVLEDALGPEALPDGSLLVIRRDRDRNVQIHRYWPETGRIGPVGPPIVPEVSGLSLRAFSDGARAVFWGKLAGKEDAPRRTYLLDLGSGRVAPLAGDLPLAPPLALAPDGSAVYGTLTAGDLQEVVSVSTAGNRAELLFPVTGRAWYLDAGPDGSFYAATLDNPAEILRFPPTGGVPDRIATTAGNLLMSPVQLPDGGVLLPSQVLGRRRLLVATQDGRLRSLLDLSEQATPPAAVVGDRMVAFLSGGIGQPPVITLASLPEGRIVRRLEAARGALPQALASSPDGKTLFYVHAGWLHAMDLEGGVPRRLIPATGVAADGRDPSPTLVVQINSADGVKLIRVPLSGGPEEPIPFAGPFRLAPSPISGTAVGPDGRIAVSVTSDDSWYRRPALLDPATGVVERVPVAFDGDIHYPGWGRDGSLLGMGVSIRSSLWRFRALPPSAKP